MDGICMRGLIGLSLLASVACDRTIHNDLASTQLDLELQDALAAQQVTGVAAPQPDPEPLVELGRMLFFDKELSGNRNISCATCHHPVAGTGDALPVSIGEGGNGLAENRAQDAGHLIPRNAPHVFNGGVAGVHSMFWDSRVTRDPVSGALKTPEPGLNGTTPTLPEYAAQLTSALAAQAMFPVTSTEEMRGQSGTNEIAAATNNVEVWEALMARLVGTDNGTTGGIDEYRRLFRVAYPAVADYDDFNFAHAARAIAAFERTVWRALDTPFDQYLSGDKSALSDAEKRGAVLFYGKARCSECHTGSLLSDFKHHAIAVPQVGPGKTEANEDRGLALQTGNAADNYKFRTPRLRNVALTGPWMHDGCFTSLEAAVRHHLDCTASLMGYDAGQLPTLFQPTVDVDGGRNQARLDALPPDLRTPMGLTEAEVQDLMDFMHALTDPDSINLIDDIPDDVPSGLPVSD
ncbi:MAG: cytochrome-c peroxidase [Planctomycetota bacterium]|jgi:cytochrome c peroxidase